MKRVAEKFGAKLPSDILGLMGFHIPDTITGKTKAIVVLQQGKGGKTLPQDSEFVTAIHEFAYTIEFATLKNHSNSFNCCLRPYGVKTERIQEGSLTDILNNYINELSRDKRVFDNDLTIKKFVKYKLLKKLLFQRVKTLDYVQNTISKKQRKNTTKLLSKLRLRVKNLNLAVKNIWLMLSIKCVVGKKTTMKKPMNLL